MFYFYGSNEFLIEKEIQDIIVRNKNASIVKFNSEVKINEIINQISSFSLFDSNRILIFYNFPYLFKKNKEDEKELLDIKKALTFKHSDTLIIFTSTTINEKNSNILVNYLKENANSKYFDELNEKELTIYVKDYLKNKGASISDIDLYYLLSKIPNKLLLIINEIEKLISLDLNITKTNIDSIVQKYDIGNTFDFINSFHSGNIDLLFQSYYDKINQGETIQNLISQIENVLELSSIIYSLKQNGFSYKEIEKITKKHSYVIKKNIEFLSVIGYKKIKKYLNMIADIDLNIKKGTIDPKIGFERFLLEICKNN